MFEVAAGSRFRDACPLRAVAGARLLPAVACDELVEAGVNVGGAIVPIRRGWFARWF